MIWHILPINDIKPHENEIVVHNSFDGREGLEIVNEIISQKKQ